MDIRTLWIFCSDNSSFKWIIKFRKKMFCFHFILCNFSVRTIQCFKKRFKNFFPQNIKKNLPQKLPIDQEFWFQQVFARSENVKIIFSRRRFLQKTNEQILLYYYETSGWLAFVRFLKKIKDIKKTFQNYLTFNLFNNLSFNEIVPQHTVELPSRSSHGVGHIFHKHWTRAIYQWCNATFLLSTFIVKTQ